jgi:hypothetical protein
LRPPLTLQSTLPLRKPLLPLTLQLKSPLPPLTLQLLSLPQLSKSQLKKVTTAIGLKALAGVS